MAESSGRLVTSVVRSWPSTILTRSSEKSAVIFVWPDHARAARPSITRSTAMRSPGPLREVEASPGIEPGCKDLQSSA